MLGNIEILINGENHITLEISLKFGSLEDMKITSSEPKDYLVISGKGLITSLLGCIFRRDYGGIPYIPLFSCRTQRNYVIPCHQKK